MKLVLAVLLLTGCGKVKVSDSEHRVSGETTTHVVVGIDTSVCDTLPEESRVECIEALLEMAREWGDSKDKEKDKEDKPKGFGGI